MNKADLTERLAAGADIPKVRAANYINIMVKAIQEALVTGEKVTISDFGTFTISQRREFTGQKQVGNSRPHVASQFSVPVWSERGTERVNTFFFDNPRAPHRRPVLLNATAAPFFPMLTDDLEKMPPTKVSAR